MSSNGIDELLRSAASRLDHATATVMSPDLPEPPRHTARVAVGALCLAAVAAGGYAISVRSPDARPAALPPGLRDGRYGTQIVVSELPDGDDDPETFSLQADPGGGYIKVTKPTGNTVSMTVDGAGQQSSPADICLDTPSGGFCGPLAELQQTHAIIGPRGADGQVVVYGLPATTRAVTVSAGTEKHWSEPVHGIVAFPFTPDASSDVVVQALDGRGVVVWQQSGADSSLTGAEIADRAVTHATQSSIADGYFGDPPSEMAYGPEIVRRHGRTALTGFTGPFAAQGYIAGNPAHALGNLQWVWAITVRSDDVAAVLKRVQGATGGTVRTTLQPSAGERVVIWAGDDVDESEITRFTATLVQQPPIAEIAIDLDQPKAFSSSDNGPYSANGDSPVEALLTDVVGSVEGHDVIAQADDIGSFQFHVADTEGGWAQIDGGTTQTDPFVVGGSPYTGLTPVPSTFTSITLTLDDGTVLTPPVIDVGDVVDAHFVYIAGGDQDRRITKVQVGTG